MSECQHEPVITVNDDRDAAEIRIDGEVVATIMQGPVDGEVSMCVPFKVRAVAKVSVVFGGGA